MRAPAARAHADRPRLGELLWPEPYPDALLEGLADWRASFAANAFRPGRTGRLLPTRANGQPAFGSYASDPRYRRFYTVGLVVLTLSDTRISPMTSFDTTTLPRFGLPASLPD